jgi:hypothetical protein
MLKRVSSLGSAKKASARRSTHPANTPADGPDSGLCTVGKSPRERKRSKGESGGGMEGAGGVDCGGTDTLVGDGRGRDEVGGVWLALLLASLVVVDLSVRGWNASR